MKKLWTVLLTICLAALLASCASQEDLDAIEAERAALQAKYDALQAECNPLQELESMYPDLFEHLDSESYPAAIALVKRLRAGKLLLEKGPIDDYLITVELTKENFNDYFDWKCIPVVNAFGEEEDYTQFVLTSKVYEEGLVLYRSEAEFELEKYGAKALDLRYSITRRGEHQADAIKVVSVSGSVTFVKSDYVLDYSVDEDGSVNYPAYPGDPFRNANVALANGENLYRPIIPEYPY